MNHEPRRFFVLEIIHLWRGAILGEYSELLHFTPIWEKAIECLEHSIRNKNLTQSE